MRRWLLVAGLLGAGAALGRASDALRETPRAPGGLGSLLGGLAAVVAQAVWLRADAALDDRRDAEALYYLDLVTDLEPQLVGAADQAAQAVGYNRAGEFQDEGAEWGFVREGLRILDASVARNPASAPALTNRGTYLFDRIARDAPMESRFVAERGEEPLTAALRDLTEARRIDPDDRRALERTAQIEVALGQRLLLERGDADAAAPHLVRGAALLREIAGPETDANPLWATIHLIDDLVAVTAAPPAERRARYDAVRTRWAERGIELPAALGAK